MDIANQTFYQERLNNPKNKNALFAAMKAQGRQCNAASVLTSKTTRGNIGHFLVCPNRACVAITSARYGLIVIGFADAD
ncbi:unnamed protein product, partial [Mesorhabditis spiculigera]